MFMLYPLAIVFSFLMTLSSMIKFNELVSFYSLGFIPKKLIKPFLFFAVLITLFMYALQFSKLSYANQYAKAIKDNFNYKTYDLFLKYKNNIVYIKVINPFSKMAWGVKVFNYKNNELKKVISAKKAVYKNNSWHAKNAEILILNDDKWVKKKKELVFLKNFTPKILTNLKTLDNISFYDAYILIRYFKDIDLNMILSILFFKIFTPLAMILIMIYLFFTAPIHVRVSNVSMFIVKAVMLSVLIWAVELMMFKFSKQGIIPFWSIAIVPLIILFFVLRRDNDRL
jgi:lipopolysaccharide export system permease protein